VLIQRVIAAVALAGLAAAAFWLSGKYARDSAARVSDIRASGRSAAEARTEVAAQRAALEAPEATYERSIRDTAAEVGLPVPAVAELAAVYPHFVELDEMVVLPAGRSWSSPHLRITAVIEKVRFQQQGAAVSANHAIARIENVSSTPVAYRVALSSADRGRCDVRGSRMHNATALRPRETADVVVCAGVGSIRIDAVEVVELGELGHRLVSRVPPAALGADPITAAAHRPEPEVQACDDLDVALFAAALRAGELRWVDLVDFFARHDCRRFAFGAGYTRATAVLSTLPAGPVRQGAPTGPAPPLPADAAGGPGGPAAVPPDAPATAGAEALP
jgi:hypothetical protein